MLKLRNEIRVSEDGGKLTARVGNPLSTRKATAVTTSKKETASSFYPSGGNHSMTTGMLPQGGMVYDTMLSGLLGENEHANMRFYRDIYHHDTVGGACVDLMSTMPFSDFHLVGCEDKSRLSVYNSAIESLNLKTLFPEVSVDYLVTGSFISTLIYKASASKFVDLITWRNEDCIITPTPFQGIDPILKVRPNAEIRDFLNNQDPQFEKLRKSMNQNMMDALRSETVDLDPLTTLFLPRKTFSYANKGTSFFKRILPLYLIEKSLYRGTLIEAGRRQRSMLHLQMGDDLWDPSPEEMQAIVALFMQADLDPLGAIVGTRAAVTPSELRQGGDFWKYTDVTDITTSMKLRALGVSESFLSGEATYASMEVSLSVFVENLRAYRDMVTRKTFHGKIFPLIAYVNGFVKNGSKVKETAGKFGEMHLRHNLNDATMLDMPNVHWTKALRPEADQAYLEVLGTLKEHGVPVSIATWAAAGGMTVDTLLKDLKEDQAIRKQIEELTGKSLDADEGDGGEGGGFEESSARALLGRRRRSILSREFKDVMVGKTRTGKPKHIINQTGERNRQYDNLARAVKNMGDANHATSVLADVKRRLGGVPDIIGGE